MKAINVLSMLRVGFLAWKLLFAAMLSVFAGSSFAQASSAQAVWDAYGCGGCHAMPAQMSPGDNRVTGQTKWGVQLLQDFATGRAQSGGSACTAAVHPDLGDRFKCWFSQNPLAFSGQSSAGQPMYDLAHSTNNSELTAMGQYMLDLLQGSVTPTTTLAFGNIAVGSSSAPVTITVGNVRASAFTFQATGPAGLDYSVSTPSCGVAGTVAGTSTLAATTCTVDVTLAPVSGATPQSENGMLTLTFATSSGDPTPGTVFWDTSLATPAYNVKPVQISLTGTSYGAITGAIASLPTAVASGSTITLDASGSHDPNPSPTITYDWAVTKDGAAFTTLHGVSPSLTNVAAGSYGFSLTVNDQYTSSTPVTRSVRAVLQPTAQITLISPASGTVFAGDSVTVDGSTSTHQAGDSLNYAWTVTSGATSIPFTTSGSTASFTASGTSSYVVKLDVDDQGVHSATQATSTITPVVAPLPTAHIANTGTVLVNVPVTLSSAGSASGDGGGFSCSWTVALHNGAAQTVTSPLTCGSATFTPTVTGDYDVTLTVTDGHGSKQATATITASNVQVTIDAGAHQTAVLGSTVSLTGSAAAIPGDSFAYAWTITSKPSGSVNTISNSTSNTTAALVVDAQGDFVVRLTATATDPQHPSGFTETTITVSPPLTSSTASLGFDAAVGSSVTASAIVTNNNAAPLTLQSVTLAGAAAADFALDASNGCTPGLAVPHASPCTLVVRFTPSVATTRNADVSLAYGASGSPLVVALVGRGSPRPLGILSSTDWNPTFADTVLGSTSQKSITLTNTSAGPTAAPLTLASLAVTGAASADYQLGGDCAASTVLAPSASCTLAITFAPTAAGARAAAVQIGLTNATVASASITMTGNGLPVPVPVVGFDPVPLNFGTQTIGNPYPPQTATITNTGQAPLVIAGVTAGGSGFAVKDASSCAGATLAVGAKCHVDVIFTPTAVQDFDGTLSIASNAPASPATLALHGTGTAAQAPVLAWSPAVTTLDFGTVQAGVVSATQSLTLTNQGPGGATLSFVNAVGAGSSAFSIKYDTCTALQPMFAGQSCRIDVQFAPAAAGARSATLQVVSNGSAPVPVTLTGTGSGGPALALALSTTAMDFGSVQMGTRSQPATLRLSNSGSGTVQVSAIQASGAFSVQGATCPATPFALQPGAECTVAVMFQPSSSGAAAGTLTVQSDAQAQAGDVALTGNGDQAPDLSSGGCSISRGDGAFDPTLWALGLLALVALALRARARRRDARGGRESAR